MIHTAPKKIGLLFGPLCLIAGCASTDAPNSPSSAAATEIEYQASSPFAKFFGTWTLADDQFQQVWDTETLQTIEIPNHITECGPINTSKSVLCVVDAGDLKGHILWAYDEGIEQVRHLSHFGEARLGDGTGVKTKSGDLRLEIRFTDEPTDTYRLYEYKWIDEDTYEMVSTQMTDAGTPTGNWYGGVFVRVQ